MKLNLSDTLEYDGETLEYEKMYFTRGMMNQGIRVYAGDRFRVHYNPETGLKRVVGPEGDSKRVEVTDDGPNDGPVQLRDSQHRSY